MDVSNDGSMIATVGRDRFVYVWKTSFDIQTFWCYYYYKLKVINTYFIFLNLVFIQKYL